MRSNILFKVVLSLVLVCSATFAKQNINLVSTNEIYFLPKQADDAKDKIVDLIKDSNKNIYISMYNFNYKKFSKELLKSAKKGLDITVIFDKSKVEDDDELYKKFKQNGIKTLIASKKMHTKLAIFDEKVIVLGSANWKKESFGENYEVILFSKDKKIINDSIKFIKAIK